MIKRIEPKVAVIVPAYNAAESLPNVLTSLKEAQRRRIVHDVIVVDDGSKDKTGEIADSEKVHVIRLPENRGKGAAFLAGVTKARELGSQILITVDADAVNLDPAHLQGIKEKLVEGGAEMVLGRVYSQRPPDVEPGLVPDGISGFRAMRAEKFDAYFNGLKNGIAVTNLARRFQEVSRGYGLERALNVLFFGLERGFYGRFPQNTIYYPQNPLIHQEKNPSPSRQIADMSAARRKISERLELLKQKRQLRSVRAQEKNGPKS